jgi:hypothetical protein
MGDDQSIPPAPQSENNANNDAAHPDSNAVPEMKVPPSHASYKITCEKKRDKWDIAKLVAELIGLGFLIAYTLYTAGIYCANRKAAEAAKSAADTAHDALVLSNRPWIKIKHHIVTPLTFGFQGAAGPAAVMTVEDTLENIGNGVALNVLHWEDVIPEDSDLSTRTARKRREEWCNANKRFDPKSSIALNGSVLFPHDPSIQESRMGPLMSTIQKAVEANAVSPILSQGPKPNPLAGKVAFVLIGCVVYRSPLDIDGTRPYMTTFLYHLTEPREYGMNFPWVTPKGTANKLQLMELPDGSSAY